MPSQLPLERSMVTTPIVELCQFLMNLSMVMSGAMSLEIGFSMPHLTRRSSSSNPGGSQEQVRGGGSKGEHVTVHISCAEMSAASQQYPPLLTTHSILT